ncbi:hypothetical protein ACOMHN_016759 [Nucella lapillus]
MHEFVHNVSTTTRNDQTSKTEIYKIVGVLKISYTPRQPKPGETIHGSQFKMGFGGKGANQCVMAAKLGASAAMVAKLGKDTYGDNTLENFKKTGVNTDHIGQTAEASSGVATIIVSEDGQNSIVIVAGANLLLDVEDARRAEEVIGAAKVLVCQLEVPSSTSLAALRFARARGGWWLSSFL